MQSRHSKEHWRAAPWLQPTLYGPERIGWQLAGARGRCPGCAGAGRELAAIRAENKDIIDRAIQIAGRISTAFENLVSTGKIAFDDLFDNNYVPIAGTDPVQYHTKFIDLIDQVLPGIQNPVYEGNPRMTLCAAIDRNGYIPVHRPKHSLPQRPGQFDWNNRNCRNRRIYDDPMRLTAARSTRPYTIQQFRHEREDEWLLIRSIAAPIRVFGKHWGAIRTTYKI